MKNKTFDKQPRILGTTIGIRPLELKDFDELHLAASDPAIWEGHPMKERYKIDVFKPYFSFLHGQGGTVVAFEKKTSEIIGCSKYYVAPDMPDSISIGFTFLVRSHWGGNTNFEFKRLMLEHAFSVFPSVWFHIDPTNIRSQKATAKLGARHIYDAMLKLQNSPAEFVCYQLTKDDWQKTCESRKID